MKKVLEELRDEMYSRLMEEYDANYGDMGDSRFQIVDHMRFLVEFVKHSDIDSLTEADKSIVNRFYDPQQNHSFNRDFAEYIFKINAEANASSKDSSIANAYIVNKLAAIGTKLAMDKLTNEAISASINARLQTLKS